MHGIVDSIYIASGAKEPMRSVPSVRAVLEKGLEGDRYSFAVGTFSDRPGPSREVTLIEIETIEAVNREKQIAFSPAESRRNIVTRGVRLNDLVDREFRVGGAILKGIRLCEPCSHLESLTGKSVLSTLVHRGGLRAQVIQEGGIQAGDSIEELPPGKKR
jgi:MOSC domain-containing protein YiiM